MAGAGGGAGGEDGAAGAAPCLEVVRSGLVALDWREAHWGGSWHGYEGGLLVGQVVAYRDSFVGAELGPAEEHWQAFLRGHQVVGRYATAEEAMAAADEAHSQSPAG